MKSFHINLALATKIVVGCMLLGCGLNSAASYFSFSQLKVGGPVYQRAGLGKDLVADILPPPEYLIEAFLEINLLRDDKANLDAHAERLAQLRKDYNERHDYWAAQNLDPAVRDLLLKSADAPARRFWALADDSFLPALRKGADGAEAFREISAVYAEHRAAIDRLVIETNRFTAEIEAEAAARDRWMTVLMAFFAFLAFAVTFAAYSGVTRLIVHPSRVITDIMKRMTRGDLSEHAPFRERPDEIGDMGRAVEVFLGNEQGRQRLAGAEKATRIKEITRQEALQQQVKKRSLAPDRRHSCPDPQYRRAHQPAGPKRHDRGGAHRRRGFAVVASEVKALSDQTGRAVDEIGEQIGHMHQSAGAAVSAIREINEKVMDISQMTQAIADAVSQQEEATREIAQNVTRAAQNSEEEAENVQAVSVTAEKTDVQAGRSPMSRKASRRRRRASARPWAALSPWWRTICKSVAARSDRA